MPETDLATMPPYLPGGEDEEARRQRLAHSGGMPPFEPQGKPAYINPLSTPHLGAQPSTPPLRPEMPPAATEPSQPPVSPTAGQPPAMPPMKLDKPAIPNAEAAAGPMPQPRMPAAPVPAPEKPFSVPGYPNGEPQLHGWRKALDVIGSMSPIGRDVETAIPGTPQNYSMRNDVANRRFNEAAARTATGQKAVEAQQGIERTAQESKMVDIPGHPELGKVEEKSLPGLLRQLEANQGRTDVADINQGGATEREQMKIDAKAAVPAGIKYGVLRQDILAQAPMPENGTPEQMAAWGKKYDELAGRSGAKKTGLGTYAMVRLLDFAAKYDPALLTAMPQILKQAGIELPAGTNLPAIPPGMPTDEHGNPIGTAMPGAPTSTTRSQGQMAEKVLDRLPDIRKEIESLKGYLGPAEGRVNVGFLLGKVGSTGDEQKDRALSTLRSDLTLMATAGARFHINSVQAMEEMEKLANAGKDSAPALQGAVDAIEKWARDAANQGRGRPAGQSSPGASTQTPGALPPGWK